MNVKNYFCYNSSAIPPSKWDNRSLQETRNIAPVFAFINWPLTIILIASGHKERVAFKTVSVLQYCTVLCKYIAARSYPLCALTTKLHSFQHYCIVILLIHTTCNSKYEKNIARRLVQNNHQIRKLSQVDLALVPQFYSSKLQIRTGSVQCNNIEMSGANIL